MEIISLVLDGMVILLLAATIFVAWKLSRGLTEFRRSRKDLDRLMQDLSRNVEKADIAITGLKAATRESGKDLDKMIADARALCDELQLMTEAGDNIASRLERLAERNRDIADRIDRTAGEQSSASRQPPPAQAQSKKAPERVVASPAPSFAIRDRDIEGGSDGISSDPDDWNSKAERELMEALRKSAVKGSGDRS